MKKTTPVYTYVFVCVCECVSFSCFFLHVLVQTVPIATQAGSGFICSSKPVVLLDSKRHHSSQIPIDRRVNHTRNILVC